MHAELDLGVRTTRARWQRLASEEDARGWATEGLLDAAYGYDPQSGVPSGFYASMRIRGAILEGLRGVLRARQVELAVARAACASATRVPVFDGFGAAAEVVPAEERLDHARLCEALRKVHTELPERDRTLLRLHFHDRSGVHGSSAREAALP